MLALSLAYGIGRAWSGHQHSLTRALAAAAGLSLLACALHHFAARSFTHAEAPAIPVWLTALVAVAFASLFFFQALLWRASAHPLGRRLYVHALNGFYVGPLANRMLHRLWPTTSHPLS